MSSFSTSLVLSYLFSAVFLSFFLFDIFGDQIGDKLAAVPQAVFLASCAAAYVAVPLIWTSQVEPAILRWSGKISAVRRVELHDTTVAFTENPLRESSISRLSSEAGSDSNIVL